MAYDSDSHNPYQSTLGGIHDDRKPSWQIVLATLCAIASLILLVTAWSAVYLLLSVGLFDRIGGEAGRFAYRVTEFIATFCAIAGISATLFAIVSGSQRQRVVMLVALVFYAPFISRIALLLFR